VVHGPSLNKSLAFFFGRVSARLPSMEQKVHSLVLSKTWSLVVLGTLAFSVPFVLAGPQFLVGSLVNFFLFSATLSLPIGFVLPLVILPSLGVLSRGLVFGPLTLFLFYLLPFIWLGNLGLILVFKKSRSFLGFLPAVILASLVKFSLLFLAASFWVRLGIIPALFLKAMGFNQLITALVGGILVFSLARSTDFLKSEKS